MNCSPFFPLSMFPIESLVLLNYPGPLGPWEADVDASWSPFCRRLPGPIIEKHQQGEALGAGRGVEALTVKHP